MKGKPKAVLEATEAVTEASAPKGAEKPVEPVSTEAETRYEVKPSEIVSIVAGNRVLFLGAGLTGIVTHGHRQI